MATRKTAKKIAKKATKKVAKKTARKAVKKVARTRPAKDSMYVSAKTGKAVTDSYAARNPSKVTPRIAQLDSNPTYSYNDQPAPVQFENAVLDINTALTTGAEDAIFWAVVRKGLFTAHVVQLFTTRRRAEIEADQLDRESGLSFNSYVVQRAPLNLDIEDDSVDGPFIL